jgi:hypothetical protein
MRHVAFVVAVASLGASAWAIGCGSTSSSTASDAGDDDASTVDDAAIDASPDAAAADAADADAGDAAAADADAAVDAGNDPFPDIDAGLWDYMPLVGIDQKAANYEGSAFDGRYLYLVPNANGLVARYDTKARFRSVRSWSLFDIEQVPAFGTNTPAHAQGFVGAIFDGKYVYFVPWLDQLAASPSFVRYDTTQPYDQVASWTLFDLGGVSAAARGFLGGVFDGRYVYLVPDANDNGSDGVVLRYDTQASFTTATSYATFDMATVNANARGYFTGIFDGRYVYFAPYVTGNGRNSLVARYDTRAAFTQSTSWSVFDATTVNAGAKGFSGSAFDGRYVYFIPGNNDVADGLLVRFDSQGTFGAPASWTTYDLSNVNANAKGFVGAAFDGRYLFLPPYNAGNGLSDTMLRFDTTTPLGDAGAFMTFPLTTYDTRAKGMGGGGFDGRYVYFTPYSDSVVVRYDSKLPPMLPAHIGSFL